MSPLAPAPKLPVHAWAWACTPGYLRVQAWWVRRSSLCTPEISSRSATFYSLANGKWPGAQTFRLEAPMGVALMQRRVVGATPTIQKFNITPMSVAWIKWAWKLNSNPNIFFIKLRFWKRLGVNCVPLGESAPRGQNCAPRGQFYFSAFCPLARTPLNLGTPILVHGCTWARAIGICII